MASQATVLAQFGQAVSQLLPAIDDRTASDLASRLSQSLSSSEALAIRFSALLSEQKEPPEPAPPEPCRCDLLINEINFSLIPGAKECSRCKQLVCAACLNESWLTCGKCLYCPQCCNDVLGLPADKRAPLSSLAALAKLNTKRARAIIASATGAPAPQGSIPGAPTQHTALISKDASDCKTPAPTRCCQKCQRIECQAHSTITKCCQQCSRCCVVISCDLCQQRTCTSCCSKDNCCVIGDRCGLARYRCPSCPIKRCSWCDDPEAWFCDGHQKRVSCSQCAASLASGHIAIEGITCTIPSKWVKGATSQDTEYFYRCCHHDDIRGLVLRTGSRVRLTCAFCPTWLRNEDAISCGHCRRRVCPKHCLSPEEPKSNSTSALLSQDQLAQTSIYANSCHACITVMQHYLLEFVPNPLVRLILIYCGEQPTLTPF